MPGFNQTAWQRQPWLCWQQPFQGWTKHPRADKAYKSALCNHKKRQRWGRGHDFLASTHRRWGGHTRAVLVRLAQLATHAAEGTMLYGDMSPVPFPSRWALDFTHWLGTNFKYTNVTQDLHGTIAQITFKGKMTMPATLLLDTVFWREH